MKPHWSEKYIGLSYEECDCAELCIKVQKEIFKRDIQLPSERASNVHGVSGQITSLKENYARKVNVFQEGDAVLMIGRGRINHIGIICFINNQTWILHAMKNTGQTVLHKATALASVGLTIEGYYTWK